MDFLAGKGLQATGKLMGLGSTLLGKALGAPFNMVDYATSKFIDRSPRLVELVVPDEIIDDDDLFRKYLIDLNKHSVAKNVQFKIKRNSEHIA
jgi:hypothetical protein